jgi:hypothetical protein
MRRRVRLGTLHEVLPRTYALVGVEALTREGRTAAAVASLQQHRCAASHVTAARALGIWRRGPARIVEVVAVTEWRPANVPWIRYHSAIELERRDVVEIGGIEYTGVIRTCLELGTCLTEWQLTHVLYEAEFLHGLDLDEPERRNRARFQRPGSAVVQAAIRHRRNGSAGTRSTSEDYLLEGVISAGLPIPEICNPNTTGVFGFECDQVWVRERLIVEVDGGGHRRSGTKDSDRDRDRDAALRAAGWRIMRVTTSELWADRASVVARVARALTI